MNKIIIGLAAVLAPVAASAQTSVSSPLTIRNVTGTTTSENFDSLSSTSTSNVLPTGFGIVEYNGTGTAADGSYAVSNGGSNAGGAYSLGTTGSTDRALGALTSGGLTPVILGGVFKNTLGAAITSLTLSYTGEQWRTASTNTLVFEYSTNATSLTSGTWTADTALDFAALATSASGAAVDGNSATFSKALTDTLNNLSIANNGTFGFRWTMSDAFGSDPALGIDNFSFTATTAASSPVPEPASWAMMIVGAGMVGGAMRRRSRSTRVAFAA